MNKYPEIMTSTEVRWFLKGPPSSARWSALASAPIESQRTDHYADLTSDAIGIKVREGRIEIKTRLQRFGNPFVAGTYSGHVEYWVKWAAPTSSDIRESTWPKFGISIAKVRRQVFFELDGRLTLFASNSPTRHGAMELTELQSSGEDHCTLAIEMFNEMSIERLTEAGRHLLQDCPLQLNLPLSMGYPEWIRRQTHASPT